MAIARVKTWIAEILTFADLNAEFNNIINNGQDVAFPATKAVDLDGNELILDSDADTSITADTDDQIDFRASGTDLFRMDGTATTPVNGVSFVASATGVPSHQIAMGADANIDYEIRSKGSGDVVLADDSGNEILVAADVATAVNEITITNAVTTAPPFVQATGDDTNIDLQLRSKGTGDVVLADDSGNEILIGADVASAVNEATITNAATGGAPTLSATGDDADVGLDYQTKGDGVHQLLDGTGNEILKTAAGVASAVNEIEIANAATGNGPEIRATGDDTNINVEVAPKGTGTLQVNGTDVLVAGGLETEQATTSGTAFDFTGIAAAAKRITIMLEGVSLDGTDQLLVQIGDSGGVETAGYISTGGRFSAAAQAITTSTAGFIIAAATAADIVSAHMVLVHMGGNSWIASHSGKRSTISVLVGGGNKTLSAELDRVRLTRTGADNFDAGAVNILVET